MKFGTFHLLSNPRMAPSVDRYRDTMEQIQLADDAGMDCAWFGEHHFSNYGYSANPLLPAVKAAALTKQIRFGQGIIVTPFWHPLRLVEDINITDILTEGRLNIGIGRGYQHKEFEPFGIKLEDSRGIFNESLELMLKAWKEEDFTFSGKYFNVPYPLTVLPKPVQAPHPPIFVAATSPETFRWVAKEGYTPMTSSSFLTAAGIAQAYKHYKRSLAEFGRPDDNFDFCSLRFVYVSATDGEAVEMIEHTRWNNRVASALAAGDENVVKGKVEALPRPDETSDDSWVKRLVFGSPQTVIEQLREIEKIGVNNIVCYFDVGNLTQKQVMKSMRLFAEKVMPAFAEKSPRVAAE